MNKIPSEILQKIFLLLHQHDKAVCMTVCRSWKHVIENSVLFDTVCLYNKQQFDNFISKNRRESNQSEKIERLIIDMEHMEITEMDILPLVILNLHELYFYENVENYNLRFTKSLSPHSWSKTIRTIKEKSTSMFTTHILESAECPNLAEISVQGTNVKLGKEFIELLSNAPALKSLSLKNFNLSLADLELLHKTTPLLSSFVLCNGAVECATLLTDIQPMIHIKKLTLEYLSVETTPEYINLQNYLALKYPMVHELVHHITVDRNADVEYNIKTGFALQIKQIGAHLTSLKITNSNCFEYIIPVLDKNGCRMKIIGMCSSVEASEVSRLAQSAQAEYVQSLSLYNLNTDNFIDYIKALTMLTELNLYCTPHSVQEGKTAISIHKLLERVGNNLKTLQLCQAKITFDPSFLRRYTSLKNLKLQKNIFPQHFDHFISQSFPKLQSLILEDNFWTEPSFYLGDLNLAYLELRQEVPSANSYVLLVTIRNNKRRFYTTKSATNHRRYIEADPTAFPAVKSLPVGPSNRLPCTTIVCNFVYDFFLVNLSDSS